MTRLKHGGRLFTLSLRTLKYILKKRKPDGYRITSRIRRNLEKLVLFQGVWIISGKRF